MYYEDLTIEIRSDGVYIGSDSGTGCNYRWEDYGVSCFQKEAFLVIIDEYVDNYMG